MTDEPGCQIREDRSWRSSDQRFRAGFFGIGLDHVVSLLWIDGAECLVPVTPAGAPPLRGFIVGPNKWRAEWCMFPPGVGGCWSEDRSQGRIEMGAL